MKQIKLFTAIIVTSSVLLFACNGKNGNANADNNTISKTATTSDASSAGDASFSYKIDGKSFSGKGTDGNFNCVNNNSGDTIKILLTDITATPAAPQLAFRVVAKGITNITQDEEDRFSSSGGEGICYANFQSYNDKVPNYARPSSFTVNITSNNGSRITGIFSGEFMDGKPIQLTDGKFDLPIIKK